MFNSSQSCNQYVDFNPNLSLDREFPIPMDYNAILLVIKNNNYFMAYKHIIYAVKIKE